MNWFKTCRKLNHIYVGYMYKLADGGDSNVFSPNTEYEQSQLSEQIIMNEWKNFVTTQQQQSIIDRIIFGPYWFSFMCEILTECCLERGLEYSGYTWIVLNEFTEVLYRNFFYTKFSNKMFRFWWKRYSEKNLPVIFKTFL